MSTLDGIDTYVRERQRDIDAALLGLLPVPPACPEVLHRAMKYSVEAGGKRVRPILCLASAEAVGGTREQAMAAACAIELVHTYSLIHDDLPAMDNDTLRRGKPTLHVVEGEGMAILAGDALLTEAFAILARPPIPSDPVQAVRALRTLHVIGEAAGARGMAGGQAIDLLAAGHAQAFDADGLRRMHAMKTGALITASAVSGAIMGGGTDDQVEAIGTAGREFGLAFQIVDDILDVEGASATLGKTAGKDAAAGKPTYPALFGLDESRRRARACLSHAASALADAGLDRSHLLEIGRWIVERSC